EGALKLARIVVGRPGFISCQNSFHGKSFGALSVTGREKYQQYFRPLLPDCTLVPYGDTEALAAALQTEKASAFIVEPIQGEGGIIIPPDNYLAEARELCHQYGALLIMDEVQTGLGRTGSLFACQQFGVEPDILCLAKALGGGVMPIGAYITTDEIWQKAYGSWSKALLHTSTFGGNTWACAAGLAALQVIIEEDLPGQAAEKGRYFLTELQKQSYPLLKEARGRGLMVGLEFNSSRSGLVGKITDKLSEEYLGSLVAGKLMNEYGIITAYTLNNPNVVRLEPPLTVSRTQLDQCLQAIQQILQGQKGFWGLGASAAKNKVKNLFKGN
ncbi:MAG: aminotransferase class III-fold pyridoxal phosphate-dependent enzyme, partial [Clostridia bacterium]|nr:aminotransferase class III-fold pyridoxal phosphate-dependent enzyme [Clostridia bacterium]